MSRCGDCKYYSECLAECLKLDENEQFAEVGGCKGFKKKKKYWASVKANFDYYTEEIEAETLEEAKSKVYDIVKEKMAIHDKDLRPFGVSVIAVGKVEENDE